jgi:hypothetical protein
MGQTAPELPSQAIMNLEIGDAQAHTVLMPEPNKSQSNQIRI